MRQPALTRGVLALSLFIFASHFANAHAQQPQPQLPCKSRPEYRQFDFWVGEWDVFNPKGQTAGTNSVQLILGDCVVFENWTGARGGRGKSFNVYQAATGKWRQTWVDNSGAVLDLIGEFKDEQMRLVGETVASDGKKTLQRLTFTKLSADKIRQLWEQSADGGKTWTVAFDGTYVRKKSAAG